ncbi:MAG TPA: bifunctional serine/threonine-protein kinase/formylglycine-generating enzyme family protein [Planctomycetota bacterium]|nr:bifunctional serine/threonine-protein kinase/formylglycine-generating enzyme family protein [Planctomycetota bacterium]
MNDPADSEPLSEELERAVEAAMALDAAAAAARIDELCGQHPEQRGEIEGLAALAGFDRPEGLAGMEPREIDGYRIVRVLGEGGMGKVYLAEQTAPVKRRVALKVIRLGVGTAAVLARFEAERQALARMSHDSIAVVFDAGQTAQGQPYFVMEYVEGVPLHEFCDRHGMSLAERLRIFQSVCDGVQHAHQKGVIHRDLKPSNILVAGTREQPRVKIIDFGLVRDLEEAADVEGAMRTEHGQLLGTPEFMSPEQAAGDLRRVDTRTDVYALGTILHFLLLGVLPFARRDLPAQTPLEFARHVREVEVRRPSSRVGDLSDADDRVFRARGLDRRQLQRQLRGDLDWIVLTALAKEPERRYPTAAALASDVERFLNHEPIVARPPSATYRLRKLVRRYRLQFAAAGLVLLTSIVGALVAIDFALEARDQAVLAARNAEKANTNLARWTRLADLRRLDALIGEANEDLWPAVPSIIPALESWLARARELAGRLPAHRIALDDLRLQAVREDDAATADAKAKAAEDTRIREIDRELDFIAADSDPRAEPYREALRREREELAAATADRRVWLFADEEAAFRHRQLQELVRGLERFCAASQDARTVTIPAVQERLEAARTLLARSAEPAFQAAWQALQADVARVDSRYHGLAVTAIQGLMPLGVDEHSGLWELHHTASGTPPEWRGVPLGRGHVVLDPESGAEGIVLVLVPGGTFVMGARAATDPADLALPNVDRVAVGWEQPLHEVSLAPFLIGKYEVTQGQWYRLMAENPSYHQPGDRCGEDVVSWRHPVTMVDWQDCHDAGRRWDLALPTEAQWEYACRAGSGDAYFTGDDPLSLIGYANLGDERAASMKVGMVQATPGFRDDHVVHAPVGYYRPNAFGLHDMHGNVQEWVREQMMPYAMWEPRAGDGLRGLWTGKPRGVGIVRGGSFLEHADFCRSASRVTNGPDTRAESAGLRLARRL